MPYQRTTRELSLASLSEPLASALHAHAAQHQLDLGTPRAFLTHSENPPAGGLLGRLLGRRDNPVDPDAAHDSVLVLHATHLLVGSAGEKRGVSVLSLPLALASVTRGFPGAAALAGIRDEGVTISGFPGRHGQPGTYFFGLGQPDGEACFAAVEGALRATRRA